MAKPLYPLVTAVTGRDVFKDSKGKKPVKNFMLGMTTEEALAEAERLRAASDAFKAKFKDKASVKKAMEDYAQGYAAAKKFALPGVPSADDLFARTVAAANTNHPIENLQNSIFTEQGPVLPKAIVPKLADKQAVAGMLISFYVRWLESQSAKPEAIAQSAGQIAHFGFLNLDPKLIAALAGSDGGGLLWLGAQTHGNKDFMHFQLTGEQQPAKMAVPAETVPGEAVA